MFNLNSHPKDQNDQYRRDCTPSLRGLYLYNSPPNPPTPAKFLANVITDPANGGWAAAPNGFFCAKTGTMEHCRIL